MVSSVIFRENLVEATFQDRPNRFLATVNLDGKKLNSFVPNPGRMHELLRPGTRVILREVKKKDRKTSFDLIGVFHNDMVVSLDSRIPNRLVHVALKNNDIKELTGYTEIKPEYSYGHTRFDFCLTNNSKPCLLEVKSSTLVEDQRALFPDAVTARGRRHVEQLTKALKEGHRACILFIIQRKDALTFSPNDKIDYKFGKALREAAEKGVEIYAYYSEFLANRVVLRGSLVVQLHASTR